MELEPERNRILSKVGTGTVTQLSKVVTVKNSYGSTTLRVTQKSRKNFSDRKISIKCWPDGFLKTKRGRIFLVFFS
jgi:hypothetical protein